MGSAELLVGRLTIVGVRLGGLVQRRARAAAGTLASRWGDLGPRPRARRPTFNLGEIALFAIAIPAGLGAPMTVVQMLLINVLTDGLPAAALTRDPPRR